MTKKHTLAWDKMKSCRRYIDQDPLTSDESDSDFKNEVTDAQFKEMLKMHLKRKKLRKKMRLAPDVSFQKMLQEVIF